MRTITLLAGLTLLAATAAGAAPTDPIAGDDRLARAPCKVVSMTGFEEHLLITCAEATAEGVDQFSAERGLTHYADSLAFATSALDTGRPLSIIYNRSPDKNPRYCEKSRCRRLYAVERH